MTPAAAPGGRRGAGPGPDREALVAWGLAALLCALHFSVYLSPDRPLIWDSRYYTYFAARIAHGAVPYRDFFENKTPLAIYVGAALDRLAHAAGLAPLHVIRGGFMLLAAVAALLTFAVFKRLGRGRCTPAFLGLLAHAAFPLLSSFPAFGVLPKLSMALCASAMALAMARGAFVLAGLAGALAFLDWQIGGLVLMGAVAGAWLGPERGRATLKVCVGAALGFTPLVVTLGMTGALRPGFDQTIGGMFGRTGPWWKTRPPAEKMEYLWANIRAGCRGHAWLVVLSLLGITLLALWLHRQRGRPGALRFLLPLALYHGGVVAFSLYDYQSYGDLYLLLHSIAFFLGVVFLDAYRRARVATRSAAWLRRALPALSLVLAVAVTRPWLLGTRLDLRQSFVGREATLADQQDVARQVFTADPRPAVIGPAELLFLEHRVNAIHPVYWNSATYHYYRRSESDEFIEPLDRILRREHVQNLVMDAGVTTQAGDTVVSSPNGAYRVILRGLVTY